MRRARSQARAIKLLNYIHKRYNNNMSDQIKNLVPVNDDYYDFLKKNRTISQNMFKRSKFKRVPLNKIVTMQYEVNKEVVIKKIRRTWKWDWPKNVHLIHYNGTYYLDDGNHRVNKAKLLGHKTIKAKVVYADKVL